VFAWASQEGHEIVRVRRGNRFNFYVLPSSTDRSSATEVDHA